MVKNTFGANLKHDLPAGIVVFLIALPLCLGIALASGAPLLSGLIAGIIGGLVTALLSSSNFSVSGPAAGLTAIVLAAITSLGSFPVFLSAVVLAGGLQLVLGFARAGAITAYIPSNVIKGMLTAIGIIIIMKQIPYAAGAHGDAEGHLAFIELDGSNTLSSLLKPFLKIHFGALIITLISMAILLLWERPFMKRVKIVPSALVAVVISVALNEIFKATGSTLSLDGDKMVDIPLFTSFQSITSVFTFPDFSQVLSKQVLITAGTIAAVASIETLLNLEAVDKLDPQRRNTNTNRELKAQGVGNIISGLLGGLPITSVIVRSSANVNAGARSKVSAITHGLLLLVCTFTIPGLLNRIPLASLAAVLLITGYKLAKISIFKQMFRKGYKQWLPFMVTLLAIVFTDLLIGVLIGLGVSILVILFDNIKMPYYFHSQKHHTGEVIHIELAQEVSFLNKASIKNTLNDLPPKSTVWIDASHSVFIDHDVLELIRELRDAQAPDKEIELYLTGFKEEYEIENSLHVISEKLQDVKKEMYRNKKAKAGIAPVNATQ